jgi:hypothetical protein
MLTIDVPKNDIALTPTIKMLKGSFRAPKNFDYKKELTDRLTEKYINNNENIA